MSPGEAFTTFQIAEKLGIKYGRLREWIDRGFIKPSIQRAGGQGSKSLFDRVDVYAIKLFSYLIERGFSRKEAAIRIWGMQGGDRATHEELLSSTTYVVCYMQDNLRDSPLTAFTPDEEVTISLFGRKLDG
ncbi:MAG: MerR family transcriptional regulator, partial [Deltaproteobacteria bacterium]|nr:MerR family transcriptional regulator [Deltaproteobacteria bacterium]